VADKGTSRKTNKDRPREAARTVERTGCYARIQKLYGESKSRCADTILAGTWKEPLKEATPMEDQEAFWCPLMKAPSHPDTVHRDQVGPALHDLCRPVSRAELDTALSKTDDTASGLDGVGRLDLRNTSKVGLLAHQNLWFVCLIDLTSVIAQIWLFGRDCEAGNLAPGVEDSQRHTQIQKHKITKNARLLV
jgi:hypothetical protein